MLGIGICNILVGRLRDTTSFSATMDFFLVLGLASIFCVFTMFCLDTEKKMYRGNRDKANDNTDSPFDEPLLDDVLV